MQLGNSKHHNEIHAQEAEERNHLLIGRYRMQPNSPQGSVKQVPATSKSLNGVPCCRLSQIRPKNSRNVSADNQISALCLESDPKGNCRSTNGRKAMFKPKIVQRQVLSSQSPPLRSQQLRYRTRSSKVCVQR